ncbi:MAG: DUF4012 domain-containing protein [Patescibacteria group bacterium]
MWLKKKTVKYKIDDFLMEHGLKKKKSKTWIWLILVGAAVIFLLVILVPLATSSQKLLNGLKAAEQKANLAFGYASSGNWSQTARTLEELNKELSIVKASSQQLGLISYLPPIKKINLSFGQLVDSANDLTFAYGMIFSVLDKMEQELDVEKLASGLSDRDNFKGLLKSIADNRQDLLLAEKKIDSAGQKLLQINTNNFSGPLKDKLLQVNKLLQTGVDNTKTALPLITNLPEILGYNQEKTYLFVFQNNMELRPTGGFIGSYGLIKIKDGKIINVFTDDIYNLDKLSEGKLLALAPVPMLKYNAQKYWYLRDANWSPDWPTSAQKIIWFFDQERAVANLPPLKLDGVIAINPDFISNLLAVIGPITAQGLTFKSDNFASDLEKFVEFDYVHNQIAKTQRKDIIGVLTGIIINKVYDLPPAELLKIWLAFKKSIDEKNILVFLTDGNLQQEFSRNNWSGEVKTADADYLMVIDSNFAALKTDQVMKRSLSYNLTVDDRGDLFGHLEVTYQHQGKYVKDLITKYRDYVRVYVPENSWFNRIAVKHNNEIKDLNLKDEVVFNKELGKSTAATFFTVEPGETKTLIFEYKLPESVKKQYQSGLYKFSVQKQPGTVGHNLKIYLDFNQPIIAYHADALPHKMDSETVSWQTDLSLDRNFTIKF